LLLELVEDLEGDPAHAGVEGVLVEEVVQVFDCHQVARQQQPVHILTVDPEILVVLLRSVEQDEGVDVDADGGVHVLDHSCVGGGVLAR